MPWPWRPRSHGDVGETWPETGLIWRAGLPLHVFWTLSPGRVANINGPGWSWFCTRLIVDSNSYNKELLFGLLSMRHNLHLKSIVGYSRQFLWSLFPAFWCHPFPSWKATLSGFARWLHQSFQGRLKVAGHCFRPRDSQILPCCCSPVDRTHRGKHGCEPFPESGDIIDIFISSHEIFSRQTSTEECHTPRCFPFPPIFFGPMECFSLRPGPAPKTRSYVLLVSGTFNPPHRGHLRLGLFAKEQLERLGHRVEARAAHDCLHGHQAHDVWIIFRSPILGP